MASAVNKLCAVKNCTYKECYSLVTSMLVYLSSSFLFPKWYVKLPYLR